MSSNPNSINYRNDELAEVAADRAKIRKARSTNALAATTGDAGLAEGNKAKRILREQGNNALDLP